VLTNSNTYTGETIVNGGLLRIDNAAALGGGNLDISGGVLGLGAGDLTTRAVGTAVGQVQWTSSGGFAAFGAERTVSFSGTSINWNATNFIGTGNTLILGHSSADATLNWQQPISFAGSLRTVQVNNGSAAVDARMSGNIAGGGSSGLNKTGAGTLELTGASNTYAGATNITAGTLRLGGSNKLPDTTNVTIDVGRLDVGAGFTDTAGALICTGAATINLGTGATLVFDDSNLQDWTGGSLNITGDFVAGSSIKFATSGGLESSQLAVISVNGGGTGTYTLNSSGFLVVGSSSPYDTWAGGPGLPFDGDANGDGVSNGMAFLLGASGPSASVTLPVVTQSGGNLVLNFNCLPVSARSGATFKVEYSTTLASWTTTMAVVPDVDNAVPDNNVTFEVEAGPAGPPALNSVQAIIDTAAAAGGGKLFARLKAVKP
jgi:autotransporter-associated beta strand protein